MRFITVLFITALVFILTTPSVSAGPVSNPTSADLLKEVLDLVNQTGQLKADLAKLSGSVDNGIANILDLVRKTLQLVFGTDPCELDLCPVAELATCDTDCIQRVSALLNIAQDYLPSLISKLHDVTVSLSESEDALGSLREKLPAQLAEVLNRCGQLTPISNNASADLSDLQGVNDLLTQILDELRSITGPDLTKVIYSIENVFALLDDVTSLSEELHKSTKVLNACRTALKTVAKKLQKLLRKGSLSSTALGTSAVPLSSCSIIRPLAESAKPAVRIPEHPIDATRIVQCALAKLKDLLDKNPNNPQIPALQHLTLEALREFNVYLNQLVNRINSLRDSGKIKLTEDDAKFIDTKLSLCHDVANQLIEDLNQTPPSTEHFNHFPGCRASLKAVLRMLNRLLGCPTGPLIGGGCGPHLVSLSEALPAAHVQLFTLTGQLIADSLTVGPLATITNRLANGVYLAVKIYTDGRREIEKLIILR